MSKKIIGIPGYKSESSFGCGVAHLEFISEFGNPRILMPHEENVDIDCLYLPGGLDLNPASYGKVPRYKTSNQDVFKQFFYDNRLDSYIERKIPIFAVCLGAQMIAAKFNMEIIQNLKWHPQSKDRWTSGHHINMKRGLLPRYTEKTAPKDRMEVNSHHHQAVICELGDNNLPIDTKETEVLAWYNDEDMNQPLCVVEAFRHRKLPIVGIQWHPEEFYDELSIKLFTDLLQ